MSPANRQRDPTTRFPIPPVWGYWPEPPPLALPLSVSEHLQQLHHLPQYHVQQYWARPIPPNRRYSIPRLWWYSIPTRFYRGFLIRSQYHVSGGIAPDCQDWGYWIPRLWWYQMPDPETPYHQFGGIVAPDPGCSDLPPICGPLTDHRQA